MGSPGSVKDAKAKRDVLRQLIKEEISSYFKDHPMTRAGAPWSIEEDAQLISEIQNFFAEVGPLHARSAGAIEYRVKKLIEESTL